MSEAALRTAEREEPVLKFLLAKSMSYDRRMHVTIALAAIGLIVQIATLSFWFGAPLILAALLLSWVVGFDNRVDYRSYHGGTHWETVPFDRLLDLLRIEKKMVSWDQSMLDITSPGGAAIWFVTVFLVGVVTFAIGQASWDAALIFGGDAALLIAFQWLNGMRRIHRKPELMLKANHLAKAAAGLEPATGTVRAQLRLRGEGDDAIPEGVKVVVQFPDGPSHFLGVQSQVVLNRVQGTPHPYCYAVLVAREGHDLLEATRGMDLPSGVIRETQTKNGVDVVVVRQRTSRPSGFKTEPRKSQQILRAAVNAAEDYVAR